MSSFQIVLRNDDNKGLRANLCFHHEFDSGSVLVQDLEGATCLSMGGDPHLKLFLSPEQAASIRDKLIEMVDLPDRTIPHPTTEELAATTPLVEKT